MQPTGLGRLTGNSAGGNSNYLNPNTPVLSGGGPVAQSGHGGLDWIPSLVGTLGGIGGGALGTAVAPGFGTAAGGIGGFGAGQALGQGIEDLLSGHKTTGGELAKTAAGGAAAGAIGGLVGKGAGALISKIPGVRQGLAGAADRLGLGGLNTTTKQLSDSYKAIENAPGKTPKVPSVSKSTSGSLKITNPAINDNVNMNEAAAQFGKNNGLTSLRPDHQAQIEQLMNSGDKPGALKLVQGLPDGDPYKQSMLNLLGGSTEPAAAEAPLSRSLAGRAGQKQGLLLASQYGTIPKNIATKTLPIQTFQNLAKIGLTAPAEVEQVAGGAIKAVDSAVMKAVGGASRVAIEGTAGKDGLPPIRQVIGDAIESNGVVGANAKSMNGIINGQLKLLAGGSRGTLAPGANPTDTMDVIREFEKRASNLFAKSYGATGELGVNSENMAQAYRQIADELKDRLYNTAGANANVARVLTPALKEQLTALAPGNKQWLAKVDDIMNQKDVAGLRTSIRDLTRGKIIIESADKNAMTFGARAGQQKPITLGGLGAAAVNSAPVKRGEAAILGKIAASPAAAKAMSIPQVAKQVVKNIGKGVARVPGATEGLPYAGYQLGSLTNRVVQNAQNAQNAPQAATSDPMSLAAQYAQDPTNPKFNGVDPAQFGYPADNTVQPGDQSQGITPDLIQNMAMSALQNSASLDDLKQNLAIVSTLSSLMPAQAVAKPPSSADVATAGSIQDAFSYLDSAEQELTQSGGAKGPVLGGLSTLPITGQYTNPSGVAYNQTKIEIASALARALTGSSRPAASIIEHYMKSLPGVNDRSTVAQSKLNNIRLELTNKAKNYASASPALAQLLSQSQDTNSLSDMANSQSQGLGGLGAF